MSTTYKIDRRRICVGGISSGMLPAYISATQGTEVYRGVWLCNLKISPRVRVPPAEPLKALHFFLNGTDPSLNPFAELAQKSGHTVAFHAEEMSAVKMIDSQVLGKLQRWMRLLEAY